MLFTNYRTSRNRADSIKLFLHDVVTPAARPRVSPYGDAKQRLAEPVTPNAIERYADLLAIVAGCILAVLPHVFAYDFGGALPRTRYWTAIAVAVVAVLALPSVYARRYAQSAVCLTIPAIAILVWLLSYCQTLPISPNLLAFLSPGSAAAYQEWIPEQIRHTPETQSSGTASSSANVADSSPASVCVAMTRSAMSTPVLFACVAFLSTFVLHGRHGILTWLSVNSLAGAIFAFIAVYDSLVIGASEFATPLITPDVFQAASFGSFVNKNNAALYLNLCLACTVALIYHQTVAHEVTQPSNNFRDRTPPPNQQLFERIAAAIPDLNASTVGLLAIAVFQFVAILLSNSRGGALAATAGLILVVLLGWGNRHRYYVITAVLAATFATFWILVFLGRDESTVDNMQSIFTLQSGSQVGRIDHWRDGITTAFAYAPFGSGLGTYRYAYLPYQDSNLGTWFLNADSMPIEWMVEGGVWLPVLVLTAIGFLFVQMRKIIRLDYPSHVRSMNLAAIFAVAATCVSQCFDFGILQPPNYLLIASVVGSVVGLSTRTAWKTTQHSYGTSQSQTVPNRRFQFACVAVVAAVLGVTWCDTLQVAKRDSATDYQMRLLSIQRHEDVNPNTLPWTQQKQAASQYIAVDPSLDEMIEQGGGTPHLKQSIAETLISQQVDRAIENIETHERSPDITIDHKLMNVEARRVFFFEMRRRDAAIPIPDALLPGQSELEIRIANQLAKSAMLDCPLNPANRQIILLTEFANEPDNDRLSNELVPQLIQLWGANTDVLKKITRIAGVSPGFDVAGPHILRSIQRDPRRSKIVLPLIQDARLREEILQAIQNRNETVASDLSASTI
ncbi:O-antigen ligase family protein [Rhodopirellula sp. SWK7]|uniref:O-antigen ligase family protein n=1 Tax=Rhodopirellula sp. SWK7 TaxID=595460 RepID=UPI0003449395|nr:O-antigen ligase family protein [Rhodopirellula sp. SWK7]